MTPAGIAGPGIGDEAVRGPIAGPGRLRLDLHPRAIAEGVLVHYRQQFGIKGRDLGVRRLDRAPAEMGRHPSPCPLELALMEEAQARRKKRDDRRRLVLRPGKFGSSPRFVVVFEKAGKLVLVVETGEQVIVDRPDMPLSQAVVEALVVA